MGPKTYKGMVSSYTSMPSHDLIHHLRMSIEVYQGQIKVLNESPPEDSCDPAAGCAHDRMISKFEEQIQECESIIDVCAEHDVIEFVLNE